MLLVSGLPKCRAYTPEAAPVRQAVIQPASMTARTRPVSGSSRHQMPEMYGRPFFWFGG